MTDGNATDMGEQFYDLAGVPPVYPVVVGADRPQKDISLTNVSVSQTSFEDAPVTIQADVEASGYAGKTVTLNLIESSGKVVESRRTADTQNLKERGKTYVSFSCAPGQERHPVLST